MEPFGSEMNSSIESEMLCHQDPASGIPEYNLREDNIVMHESAQLSKVSSDAVVINEQHSAESQRLQLQACSSSVQHETTAIGAQEVQISHNMRLSLTYTPAAAQTFDVFEKVKKDCSKDGGSQRYLKLTNTMDKLSLDLSELLPFLPITNGTLTLKICTSNAEDSRRFRNSEELVFHTFQHEKNRTEIENVVVSTDSQGMISSVVDDETSVVSAAQMPGVKLKMQIAKPAQTVIGEILDGISMRGQESPVDDCRDVNQATQTPTVAIPSGGFVDLASAMVSAKMTPDAEIEFINKSQKKFNELWDLGEGTFGKVVLMQCQDTGRFLADKQLKLHTEGLDEVKIMSDLSHKNVVRLIGSYCDNNKYHILLDWYPVTLADLVECQKHLCDTLIIAYMHQLLEGLAYLHDVQLVVHRDIKPANLFLTSRGTLQIGDFGHACPLRDCRQDRHPLGTLLYNAPEYMRGEPYSTACDIWSSGVVLVFMATGKTIWPNWETAAEVNQTVLIFWIGNIEKTPDLPELKSELLYDLMAQCLRVEKEIRPSAQILLTHDVFREQRTSMAVRTEYTVTDVSNALATMNTM